MKIYEQKPSLSGIGVRAMLLKIHKDLLNIHYKTHEYFAYYPQGLTNLEKLVIALEDRRFMKHNGLDIISGVRELLRATTFQKHGGASTIDMQFVRTVTGYKRRTLGRKFYEIILAVLIQFRYSKIVILRSYLNTAFFGSKLTGATAAARRLFNSDTESLSVNDAAVIAAMLVYPKPLNEEKEWLAKVRRRANYGVRVYLRNKKSFDKLPS